MDPTNLPPIVPSIGFILSTVFWVIAYGLIIRRGFKDETFGMPILAGTCAFGWEILGVTLRRFPEGFYPALVWVVIDGVVFYQGLKYGRRDFEHPFIRKYFYPIVFSAFFYAMALMYFFEVQFDDQYRFASGYGVNLLISPLSIVMLLRRDSSRGQSMYIAIFRTIGTFAVFAQIAYDKAQILSGEAAPTALNEPRALFIGVQQAGILAMDVLYSILLYKKLKEEGQNPWRRF